MTELHLINKHQISLFCQCSHESAFSVEELLEGLQPDTTVNQVADKARCTVCGRKGKSLDCSGNVVEEICQITNKHHFGLEASSTLS